MEEKKSNTLENMKYNEHRVTFKEIKKANDSIVTTDVKGKNYAEVNQRIKVFRMLYPQGFIHTEIVSIKDGVCIMRAEVGFFDYVHRDSTEIRNFDRVVLGTGTAYEKEGSSFINKTSYIENCETSAVGRALAMCGIGIDTSVASKEEVENAKANQKTKRVPTVTVLKAKIKTAQLTDEEMENTLKYYKVDSLEKLSDAQKIELEDNLLKRIKKLNESDS